MTMLIQAACLLLMLSAAWGADLNAASQGGAPLPGSAGEVVYGILRDAATGKPLAGATVALRARKGQVIAWGKTDADGNYALGGRFTGSVRLPTYKERNRSLLGQIVRGADAVVGFAVKSAGFLARPVARAAGSAVGGPLVGEVAAQVAHSVVPPPEEHPLELPDPDGPAVFTAKVVCPGYQDYQGPVQAYWMAPPDPDGGRALTFRLDPIALAPRADAPKRFSGPRAEMMRLRQAALEPGIAPRGSEFVVSVRLDVPAPAQGCVRVLARHTESHESVELRPAKAQPGLFCARMRVGAEWPANDQRIVILALRARPASPEGPRAAEPEELAEKLSLWKSRKLAFDPQILASRDRETLTLTVVE